MENPLPNQLILSYKEFYNEDPPSNRLDLLQGVSKNFIIHELASLNYTIKPVTSTFYDYALQRQLDTLRYFSGEDEVVARKHFNFFRPHFKDDKHYAIIFHRAANLVALEEIIYSDLPEIKDFKITSEASQAIIRYYLSINSAIVGFKEIPPGTTTEKFEHVHAALVPLNEYNVGIDPIFLPYRGLQLFKFYLEHPKYGVHINDYFKNVLEIEPKQFIFMMLEISLQKKADVRDNYLYHVPPDRSKFYNYLSDRSVKPSKNILECLSIKKSPFYLDPYGNYLLLDNSLLIEKSYDLFLNDVWFDYLKSIFPSREGFGNYRSELVGPFLESYLEGILKWSFHFLSHPEPKFFNQLKIQTSSSEIELADVYIRQNKKIMIGQAKSKGIYSKEKYSGGHDFFKDKEEFYKEIGVDQLINSLNYLHESPQLYDDKIKDYKKLEVFPVLIVNDKTFQTGMANQIINERFQEKIKNISYSKFQLYPVIIIHISDLERISEYLHYKEVQIWGVLKSHYKQLLLLRPFYITLNRYLEGRRYPNYVIHGYREIIKEYNPDGYDQ